MTERDTVSPYLLRDLRGWRERWLERLAREIEEWEAR